MIPDSIRTLRRPAISLPRALDAISTALGLSFAITAASAAATAPVESFSNSTPV